MSKEGIRNWAIILISFGLAITAVIFVARNKDTVEMLVRRLGAAGPLLMVVLYMIVALSPVPADALTVINGGVFGPIQGALIAWVGITAAAFVEYYIGTRLRDASDFEEIRDDLPLGLGDLPADSVWFLLGGRMLTSAGSKIVSYISGIYEVPLWRYGWTTAVASFVGALFFALGGFGLLQIF